MIFTHSGWSLRSTACRIAAGIVRWRERARKTLGVVSAAEIVPTLDLATLGEAAARQRRSIEAIAGKAGAEAIVGKPSVAASTVNSSIKSTSAGLAAVNVAGKLKVAKAEAKVSPRAKARQRAAARAKPEAKTKGTYADKWPWYSLSGRA